jgi:hypothetical protein
METAKPPRLLPLTLLLVGALAGCKQRPRECEAQAFFQPADPGSIRTGVAVPAGRIQSHPKRLTFLPDDRVFVEWVSLGHIWSSMDLSYSPGASKARVIRPEKHAGDAYPLLDELEGKAHRVKLGFFSPLCAPNELAPDCMQHEDNQFLVADMLCNR